MEMKISLKEVRSIVRSVLREATCPSCGSGNAYTGLNDVECDRRGCRHFSQRQYDDVHGAGIDWTFDDVYEAYRILEDEGLFFGHEDETNPKMAGPKEVASLAGWLSSNGGPRSPSELDNSLKEFQRIHNDEQGGALLQNDLLVIRDLMNRANAEVMDSAARGLR